MGPFGKIAAAGPRLSVGRFRWDVPRRSRRPWPRRSSHLSSAASSDQPRDTDPTATRALGRTPCWIGVQARVARDLILDQPANDEGSFVGVRLRVQRNRGPAAVDSATQVSDPQVRKARFRALDDRTRVLLQRSSVCRKVALGQNVGELDPSDVYLVARLASQGRREFALLPLRLSNG